MSATDWRKSGRDAAHEDATSEDAAPCTTLDDARVRCAAWLEDVEGVDVEAAAEGYLAGWTAHLRDAADTTAPLDLDAIHARILAAPSCDCGRPSTQWCADSECGAESCDGHARQTGALGHEHRWARYPIATEDAAALLAEASHLRAVRDASAQAYDDLVALAWHAATGDEHEGPASVDDLIATLRTMRATARREGAEAMREAAAQEAARNGNEWARRERRCDCGLSFAGLASAESVTATIRALPLPEVDAGQRDVTAYRAGAAKMREACVDALDAMAHAEGVDAERFRLTRGEDSAAEHHHKRAALLEARVTVLGLPLPEVTP